MRVIPRLACVLSAFGLLAVLAGPCAAEIVRIGVTSGPHAQIVEALVPVAKAKGLDIKVVEFSDGAMIDIATQEGALEANAFQHFPYLDQQNHDRGLDIVSVTPTVLLPIAGYSRKYKSVADLPKGAQVAIPSDPTNAGRSLKLLEAGGLIKLTSGIGFNATVLNIISNPKDAKIIELEATQVPRSLEDVDFAIINTNFAIQVGLDPIKDSLLRETEQSEYFCLIGVARKNADKPWVKTLIDSYRSPEVKKFVETAFKGSILTGW